MSTHTQRLETLLEQQQRERLAAIADCNVLAEPDRSLLWWWLGVTYRLLSLGQFAEAAT
jgi:hypothetical protein